MAEALAAAGAEPLPPRAGPELPRCTCECPLGTPPPRRMPTGVLRVSKKAMLLRTEEMEGEGARGAGVLWPEADSKCRTISSTALPWDVRCHAAAWPPLAEPGASSSAAGAGTRTVEGCGVCRATAAFLALGSSVLARVLSEAAVDRGAASCRLCSFPASRGDSGCAGAKRPGFRHTLQSFGVVGGEVSSSVHCARDGCAKAAAAPARGSALRVRRAAPPPGEPGSHTMGAGAALATEGAEVRW
mmetsp:Transcript_2996/g.8666  ORF Transcript_2996/g.8666 Transcript_2996/m.8666 type:complete len:244 (-) Transcript_2996:211-942(-)